MGNKFVFTAVAGFFALMLNAGQVLAHAEHGQPQYGGVVAEAGEAQFEIVGKGGQITVYATNHGAPVATAGASGAGIDLPGGLRLRRELDRLVLAGTSGAGPDRALRIPSSGTAAGRNNASLRCHSHGQLENVEWTATGSVRDT